jgi:hypothetical protein
LFHPYSGKFVNLFIIIWKKDFCPLAIHYWGNS